MRSKSYPMFELSTIVDILRNSRKAGKVINKQLLANIASNSNKASTKSGIFNQRLSAFKHYNLACVEKNKITFTPLADLAISENKTALRKAFLAPETFKNLYNTVEKEVYLKKSFLKSIAMLQIGISENGKKTFVNNFIASGIYCGLIEYSIGTNEEVIIKNFPRNSDKEIELKYREKEKETESQKMDKQKAILKISEGEAIIIVPHNLSEKDKEKLRAQINLF